MPAPQLTLFETGTTGAREARSGSFIDNMQAPIHRWFRYSAGFSAQWVRTLIDERRTASGFCVFDPFAGSGTVLLAAERSGVEGIGIEAHPFVARLAKAKLGWREDMTNFRKLAKRIVCMARESGGTSDGLSSADWQMLSGSKLVPARRLALSVGRVGRRQRRGRIVLVGLGSGASALLARRNRSMAVRAAERIEGQIA
jgi:hypothetical protein